MIGELIKFIGDTFPTATFGQIQDEPDSLLNINIYDNSNSPFFNDTSTHTLTINLFIRDASFEVMLENNEVINTWLVDLYDADILNIHIVNTKKTGSQDPSRDDKNRYYIYSTFEMLVEEV